MECLTNRLYVSLSFSLWSKNAYSLFWKLEQPHHEECSVIFFSRTACNWLSSRRWVIQNWICSGWNRIEILLRRRKSPERGFPAFFSRVALAAASYTITGSAHPQVCVDLQKGKEKTFATFFSPSYLVSLHFLLGYHLSLLLHLRLRSRAHTASCSST